MFENSLLGMYIILNAFLFIFGAVIFFRLTSDLAKKSEYIIFRTFIVAFQFYLLMNSLWTLQEYNVIDIPRGLYIVICLSSYIAVNFNAFCFYAYTMIRFDFEFGKKLWASIVGLLPFLASVVLLIISLFNGIIFSITPEKHVVTGPIYHVMAACCFIYFVIIVGVSIDKALKVRTSFARRDAISLTASVIFLILWVIFDSFFDNITIIPIAIFSIIMFQFIALLQSSVYTDALTQMNNRRKAEEYVNSQIENSSENSPLYLFIIDIDSFKQINDTFGHAEGDAVLILFATVAKKVIAAHSGFTARYGGDEFVLAWRPQKENDVSPQELLEELHSHFSEACEKENKPYDMSFSSGFVKCVDPNKTFSSYLKEADDMMYRNKRHFYAVNK